RGGGGGADGDGVVRGIVGDIHVRVRRDVHVRSPGGPVPEVSFDAVARGRRPSELEQVRDEVRAVHGDGDASRGRDAGRVYVGRDIVAQFCGRVRDGDGSRGGRRCRDGERGDVREGRRTMGPRELHPGDVHGGPEGG